MICTVHIYIYVCMHMYALSALWSPHHSPHPLRPAHRSVPIRRCGRHRWGAADGAPAAQRVPRELREAFEFVDPAARRHGSPKEAPKHGTNLGPIWEDQLSWTVVEFVDEVWTVWTF